MYNVISEKSEADKESFLNTVNALPNREGVYYAVRVKNKKGIRGKKKRA